MRCSARSRTSGISVRTVPASMACSGMMLWAKPALNFVTETTTENSGSAEREAIVCSAPTICEPMTIGSIVLCGWAAWPPRPSMVMVNSSVEAMIGPDAAAELADRHARHIVHAVDFLDGETLHHAVLDHLVAAGAAFFGRLEDHGDRAFEIAGLGKIFCSAQKHGGVAVMAAGVHLARRGRGPGLATGLGHRQRVHVGAQADGAAFAEIALDQADDAGAAETGHDFVNAKLFQFIFDESCRIFDGKQQFRLGVEVATPFRDFGLEFCCAVQNRHFGFLWVHCGKGYEILGIGTKEWSLPSPRHIG
jgi:hypothetical protein